MITNARTALMQLEEFMQKSLGNGPRLLALVAAMSLMAAPALARDVTVYGGGKSKTFSKQDGDAPRVIAWGQDRETAIEKRAARFAMERKVQSILESRDTDDARETSDAMMRIILRGNRDARQQYSRYYPYHVRSADFYDRLKEKLREQETGVVVYRQSILDKVSTSDLERVSEALKQTD